MAAKWAACSSICSSKWIFQSGFQFADTFRFEYIDTSLSKDNYCELDIYQPIME